MEERRVTANGIDFAYLEEGRGPTVFLLHGYPDNAHTWSHQIPALAAAGYRVSHRDLNDRTVEGLVHGSGRIASVQFHPEGAPGPIDASRIFDLALERAKA